MAVLGSGGVAMRRRRVLRIWRRLLKVSVRIFIEHHALIATCVVVVEEGLLLLVEEKDLIS